jgi:hypothetical protein
LHFKGRTLTEGVRELGTEESTWAYGGGSKKGTLENFMMMNLILYISHHLFLGRSNGEEEMGKVSGLYGGE